MHILNIVFISLLGQKHGRDLPQHLLLQVLLFLLARSFRQILGCVIFSVQSCHLQPPGLPEPPVSLPERHCLMKCPPEIRLYSFCPLPSHYLVLLPALTAHIVATLSSSAPSLVLLAPPHHVSSNISRKTDVTAPASSFFFTELQQVSLRTAAAGLEKALNGVGPVCCTLTRGNNVCSLS